MMSFILLLLLLGGGCLTFLLVSHLVSRIMRPSPSTPPEEQEATTGEESTSAPASWFVWDSLRSFIYKILRISRVAPAGPLYKSFSVALKILRSRSLKSNAKYDLPWCLVVGSRSSGKDFLLQGLSLPKPIHSPAAQCAGALDWWFFEKGVALNVDSQCFLSQNAPEVCWLTLLRNLQHWRPRNPIDAVVITISLEDLLTLSEEDLVAQATKISRPLLMLEGTLSVTLPLHIIITKTDVLPGFSGLPQTLNTDEKKQLFGWTNKDDASKRFDTTHIREAIDTIQADLYAWTLHNFTHSTNTQFHDDIMVFAERLGSLKDTLSRYLKTLLKIGGYEDNFYVRGISFTGQEGVGQKVSFGDDLLQEKVFQERGVTQPINRLFGNNNRLIVWLKTTIALITILWGGGLFWSHNQLQETVLSLQPLMYYSSPATINGEIDMFKSSFKTMSSKTLDLLVQSAKYDLFSWFIPLSWISPLEKVFDERVFALFNTFIAQPMHKSFAFKVEKLLFGTLQNTEEDGASLALTDVAAFADLSDFVDGIETLEDHAVLYNALPKTQDIRSFKAVIRYLYNFDLSEQFVTQKTLLQEKVLKNALYKPFYLSQYTQQAREKFFTLFNGFLVAGFNPNRLFEAPRALQDTLERLDRNGVDSLEEIYSLLEFLDNTIGILEKGGLWLAQENFSAPKDLEKVIETIEKTTFLGPKVVEHANESLQKIFQKTSTFLESFGSTMTGHFFVRSQETGLLVPGVGLIALRKALVLALKQGFMQRASYESLTQKIPQGQILHWDKHMVQKAILLLKDYQNFVDNDLQTFPTEIQDAMKLISRKQLEANLETTLARAQTFFQIPVARWSNRSEEASRAYADNLREVSPLFATILEELDRVGAHTLFVSLRDTLFKQMYNHLEQLDHLVQQGAFLYPDLNNLRWWKGARGPVLTAYGADDRLEMRTLWSNELKRFKDMMNVHIVPVLDLLKSPLMHAATKEAKIIDRWVRVSEQLEAYESGKDSTLKMLEAFIMEEGNNITFENHREHIGERDLERKYSDVFLDVLGSLKKALFLRCKQIMAEQTVADYTSLARHFNQNMAESYPFVSEIPTGDRPEMEVAPEVLTKFYEGFSKLTPERLASVKKHPKYGSSFKSINKFLADMLKVKTFLDNHFSPAKKGDNPGISFSVEYRVNKDRDSLGDHVIDWAVISGENTISLQEGRTEGYWRAGDPFSVGIQFVGQSPLMPVQDPSQPNMVVVYDRALFVYEGVWGWLRMIQSQQATADQGKLGSDTLLAFTVPMAARTTGAVTDKAKIFMRVIPRKVNGQSHRNFKVPPFPVRAPFFET